MKKAIYFASTVISGSIMLGSSIIAVSNIESHGLQGAIDWVFVLGCLVLLGSIFILFSNIKE